MSGTSGKTTVLQIVKTVNLTELWNVPNACLAKGRDTELLVQNFHIRKLVPKIRDLQIVYRNNDESIPPRKWHT